MATARITSKGQITVPKAVRDHLGVESGDALAFDLEGDRIVVRPVRRRRLAELRGQFAGLPATERDQERTLAWTAMTERLATGARASGRRHDGALSRYPS